MLTPIRCLLAAPTPGHDSESGDVQYARDLLSSPPDGVTYVTYADAMRSGELVDAGSFRRRGNFPRGPKSLAVATARTALYGVKRAGLLLPDPVRWWDVVGDFDVVHSHCFPLRLFGKVPPVVVTDSAGSFWYWTAGAGRPEGAVWRMHRWERRLARALRYIHPIAAPDKASSTLYFIESGRRMAQTLGVDPRSIQIVPAGVPSAIRQSVQPMNPPTLLFVGRYFDAKGGPDAVEALGIVRATFPDCRLWVAGPTSPDPHWPGVTWLGSLTREELYQSVYPDADLFLYPTRLDVAPLVVAEALAHGLPVVGPRAFGIPDLVRDGQTGVLVEPRRPDLLAEAVLGLLSDPRRLRQFGHAASVDFAARMSIPIRNDALGAAYRQAARR